MSNILKGYIFSNNLQELVSQSDLPVQEVYYILKDTFNEVEKLYFQQIEKEIKLQKTILMKPLIY